MIFGFICDCGSYQDFRRKGIITVYFHILAENRDVRFFRIFDGFEARRRWVSGLLAYHRLWPSSVTFHFSPSLWFCEKSKIPERNFGIADAERDNRASEASVTDGLLPDSPIRYAGQPVLRSGISHPAIQAGRVDTRTSISALCVERGM